MSNIAFDVACQLWEADKQAYVKASSMAAYSLTIERHLKPHFAYIQDVTPDRVQELVDEAVNNGMTLSTLKGILVVLKMILRFCEKRGWMEGVMLDVRFPKKIKRKSQPTVLPIKEEKRLIYYLTEHPTSMNTGLLICLCCGLRIGEVCALKWEDVDFYNRVIHVSKTLYRIYHLHEGKGRSEVVIGPPKTITSLREVPITGLLNDILHKLRKGRNRDYYIASGMMTPADPQTFRNNFKRVTDSLKLPPRKVHSLRHTFATRCVEAECDYKTLSSLLGHANVSTTMNLYVHPDIERKRKCIEKMMEIF